MLTLIAFLALNYFGYEYSGWLYVLPVLFDLVLLDKIDKK